MNRLLKILGWGFIISFLGTLPLGTMNVTATNIAVQQGTHEAFLFALGSLVIETISLCIVLGMMNRVMHKRHVFRVFEWITALLILALSAGCFMAAIEMKKFGNNVFTAYHFPPFMLGLFLSLLNPLHIPFWFSWTTLLINKNVLLLQPKYTAIYVTGTCVGTIFGFDVFIYGGNYIVRQLSDKQNILNWTVGIVLLITAAIQLYKLVNKKAGVINMTQDTPVVTINSLS